MFGDYYLIITGLISVAWTAALIVWCARNPGQRIPLMLLAGPIVTGILAVLEGAGRFT